MTVVRFRILGPSLGVTGLGRESTESLVLGTRVVIKSDNLSRTICGL